MKDARPEESTPTSSLGIADRLRACLRERVELEALVLFGSRARNDAFDESDWDFAVISGDFHGLDPLARAHRTVDCRLPLVDLVHLTPEELLEPDASYLRCAILEEGMVIVDAGCFARAPSSLPLISAIVPGSTELPSRRTKASRSWPVVRGAPPGGRGSRSGPSDR